MKQQYKLKLKAKDRDQLISIIRKGSEKARKITRCRILLLSNDGESQSTIAKMLKLTNRTVRNICKRYLKEGLMGAIEEKPRPGQPCIFDGKARAKITALACSQAPEGRSRWSLNLLSDKAVELGIVESISHMQVHRILKKTKSNPT